MYTQTYPHNITIICMYVD